MKRLSLVLPLAAALVIPSAIPAAADPKPGNQQFKPHLPVLGFDTLGAPSTGLNAEVDLHPTEKVVYVGSLNFDADEFPAGDQNVKVVDVTDPTEPVMTAELPTIGDLGPFDVKVAGNVVAASVQGFPESNPGVTLFDATDPRHPVFATHIGNVELSSPFGSHNSFLWHDMLTGRTWLFATGLDLTSLKIFDVTDPRNPVFTAEYHNQNSDPFVHDNFVQENAGRVLNYHASGNKGMEILDVTRIVRGGETGLLTFESDVVAFNHYTSNPADAATVTRPRFSHYIEPTASGRVTWVGDETACDDPGIIHAFDTSVVPPPPAKVRLQEIGVIIEEPDPESQCAAATHANSESAAANSQTNEFRWTGHNFDIFGDDLMIRGNYGKGVYVYDISDPTSAGWVAKSRGLNRGVGDENRTDPGRDKALENYPFFWQARFDPNGSFIYASDINQGLYVLDLIEK